MELLKSFQSNHPLDWTDIRPGQHFVQIYDDEKTFLDTLQTFVSTGLQADECVVVIATGWHVKALNARLESSGVDWAAALDESRYIVRDAETTLSNLTDSGWPSEDSFERLIEEIIEEAACSDRSVRAFGELVALLWAEGNHAGTLRLESLWTRYCKKHSFALFHAYPKYGFTDFHLKSLHDICDLHSQVIQ